jgi:3-methyladenine DNA glycosylase/8-oxoguanine DNA glycosylase
VRLDDVHDALEAVLDEQREPARMLDNVVGRLGLVGELEADAGFVTQQPDPRGIVEASRGRVGAREDVDRPVGELDHERHATAPWREGTLRLVRPTERHIPIELPLLGAGGEAVDLWRTLLSHGFAGLPPTRVDEDARTLELTLRIPRGKPRRVRISAGRPGFASLDVLGRAAVSPPACDALVRGAAHVLRLDQDLAPFYALVADDSELAWVAAGAGRMLRSPTVFEDVVKTICTTNCSWSLTTTMVTALVTRLGDASSGFEHDPLANAFPTAAAMAAQPESFYRSVVRAGYRARYFCELARRVSDGELDLERLGTTSREELTDLELERFLRSLPGVGPYAAAHIMMTLGRNSRLILDSWTRPTYARLLGRRSVPADRVIERRFRRYGDHAGLAFWLFLTRDWAD